MADTENKNDQGIDLSNLVYYKILLPCKKQNCEVYK